LSEAEGSLFSFTTNILSNPDTHPTSRTYLSGCAAVKEGTAILRLRCQ
jgi:hypothetical protein